MTHRSAFLFVCLFLLGGASEILAQTTTPAPASLPARVEDAIRFTNFFPLGTARFAGTNGSMTSMGVDFTTLSTNPAGIGWNRNNSASITPGFTLHNNRSTLRGNNLNPSTAENDFVFNIPSFGLVWTRQNEYTGMPSLNWSIALNRLADFNQTLDYNGFSGGSIIDALVEDINDNIGDPFRVNLLDQIDSDIRFLDVNDNFDTLPLLVDEFGYFSDFDLADNQGAQVRREGRVERSGSMNEFAFGIGGNANNKLLWGISIGIPFLSFDEVKTYSEVDANNEVSTFDDASYDEELSISGSGVNFKLGAIYLPSVATRISLAVHSPTFWTLDETFETRLEYNYTTADGVARGGAGLSPQSISVVNLQTPWRFQLGLGGLIGRSGFITADAEYVNYAGNSFSFQEFSVPDEVSNNDIDAVLGGAVSLRLGGEINLDPVQVRLGAGYRTLPTQAARYGQDEGYLSGSAGLGFNLGKLFIDVATTVQQENNFYSPYRTFGFDGQVVDTERVQVSGLVTVGYRGF